MNDVRKWLHTGASQGTATDQQSTIELFSILTYKIHVIQLIRQQKSKTEKYFFEPDCLLDIQSTTLTITIKEPSVT